MLGTMTDILFSNLSLILQFQAAAWCPDTWNAKMATNVLKLALSVIWIMTAKTTLMSMMTVNIGTVCVFPNAGPFLPDSLHTCQPVCLYDHVTSRPLPAYLHADLPVCMPVYLRACLSTYLPICLLFACLCAYLPPVCLPACLPTSMIFFLLTAI